MVSAIILLIRVGGGFSFGQIALGHAAILKYAVLWAMACVMIGFSEEFLFRGYTQFTLASGIGFWPAAILLSAGFTVLHLLNGGERLVGGLSVFVIAMFLCLTLRRTGNLWFAVGLHMAFDRLTGFEGKIQVLSLVSFTARRSLPNLPQLSVAVTRPPSP